MASVVVDGQPCAGGIGGPGCIPTAGNSRSAMPRGPCGGPAGLGFSAAIVAWPASGPLWGSWASRRLWDLSVSSQELSMPRTLVQEEVHDSL